MKLRLQNFFMNANPQRNQQQEKGQLRQQQLEQPQPREIWYLAIIVDLAYISGILPPAYARVVRFVALIVLIHSGILALLITAALPLSVPLTFVCFARRCLRQFNDMAEKGVANLSKATESSSSGDGDGDGDGGGGGGGGGACGGDEYVDIAANGPTTGVRARVKRGEVSGYDVSSVSGDEVVELSSWTR